MNIVLKPGEVKSLITADGSTYRVANRDSVEVSVWTDDRNELHTSSPACIISAPSYPIEVLDDVALEELRLEIADCLRSD